MQIRMGRRSLSTSPTRSDGAMIIANAILKFPNAVVLNAAGRRKGQRAQMRANYCKGAQTQALKVARLQYEVDMKEFY